MKNVGFIILILMMNACQLNSNNTEQWYIEAYETSPNHNFSRIFPTLNEEASSTIKIDSSHQLQTITGFGGAFTESSAWLLNQLSPQKYKEVINAYFSESGANYSLCRTHMNSCDFSLSQYSYAPIEDDKQLEHFSVVEDEDDIIPMILKAQEVSSNGFKLIASPWTAPPWMKDNKDWVGGKLLPEYYDTWALFFEKYYFAYQEKGIDIWGFTVENEPHGNGDNWESMLFTPKEMTDFVQFHLGPQLEKANINAKVLGYDQNRLGIQEWVDVMYENEETSRYYDGTAIHWYESTYDFFPEQLQYAHQKAPDKYLIQTEACVDSEIPAWKDDQWYWRKEATDWGWDWAPEDQKHLHPKYVPVFRYARDIIGCLNNHVDGWVDWNMILDKQGGPNWFENWCAAPVLVDIESDEVYYTPLYYTMMHFSKFIRPEAKIIASSCNDDALMTTAALNQDGSIVLVVFNPENQAKKINIVLGENKIGVSIEGSAIQTIILNKTISNE